jgi:uncharacterized protein YegJ (DUF2314 family)
MDNKFIIFAVLFIIAVIFTVAKNRYSNKNVDLGGTQEDPTFAVSKDNELVNAAMNDARNSIDKLITEMEKGQEGFMASIKVKVTDKDQVEYMWLSNLKYENGTFSGKIDNDPEIVKNVSYGDQWQTPKNEVCDWIYQKDGKLFGNYTFKASIKNLSKERQSDLLKDYGDVNELSK